MPAQTSRRAVPFGTILAQAVTLLRAALPGVPVHVVARPGDSLPEYQAQDAVLLWVSPPTPRPANGAGRYNALASRVLSAVVLTQNLSDPAHEDVIAVTAHLSREDAVVNALHHVLANNPTDGTLCEWCEGGDAAARQVRTDPGVIKSGLCFRVQYIAPMTVVRD